MDLVHGRLGMGSMGMGSTGSGTGMAMGMDHHGATALSQTCDGAPFTGLHSQRTSSRANHLVPGVFLLFWAAHWTVGVFRSWFQSNGRALYTARTTYGHPPLLPESRYPIEATVKVLFPLFAIPTVLWWSHEHARCDDGNSLFSTQ
jgi:ABC-type uncharacterized transport system permease subunit